MRATLDETMRLCEASSCGAGCGCSLGIWPWVVGVGGVQAETKRRVRSERGRDRRSRVTDWPYKVVPILQPSILVVSLSAII